MSTARSTAGRSAHDNRPARESWGKRFPKLARVIRERDGHRCVYCSQSKEESGRWLTFDHLTARENGGEDTIANVVLACYSCNSSKQDMTDKQWEAYIQTKRNLTISMREIRAHARKAA